MEIYKANCRRDDLQHFRNYKISYQLSTLKQIRENIRKKQIARQIKHPHFE